MKTQLKETQQTCSKQETVFAYYQKKKENLLCFFSEAGNEMLRNREKDNWTIQEREGQKDKDND